MTTDATLRESEFALLAGGEALARTTAALGSPQQPLSAEALAAKVEALAPGLVLDPRRPAAALLPDE